MQRKKGTQKRGRKNKRMKERNGNEESAPKETEEQ